MRVEGRVGTSERRASDATSSGEEWLLQLLFLLSTAAARDEAACRLAMVAEPWPEINEGKVGDKCHTGMKYFIAALTNVSRKK